MAQIRSPLRSRTRSPVPCRTPSDAVRTYSAKAGLAVRPRRHEVVGPARPDDGGAESGDGVAAGVLERHRRHRHRDVLGEQVDECRDVGGLVGTDEPRDERALRRRIGSGGRFALAGRREAAPKAGASPLEGAVDRSDGRVEHAGHLARAVAEHVAQDEHGELAGRQELERGHERQGDGLRLFGAGLRPGRCGRRTREERVGVRLEPHDLARFPSARADRRRGCPTPWPGVAGRRVAR